MRRFSDTKICPRCGEKVLIGQKTCPDCGLQFSKLLKCTNKAGKRAYLRRKKDVLLWTRDWPIDAKVSTSLWLCGFLGLYGIHNFYLGRYIKAVFCLISALVSSVLACITVYPKYYDLFVSIFSIPLALPFIFWILDFLRIATGKYKIPIALDEVKYGKELGDNNNG